MGFDVKLYIQLFMLLCSRMVQMASLNQFDKNWEYMFFEGVAQSLNLTTNSNTTKTTLWPIFDLFFICCDRKWTFKSIRIPRWIFMNICIKLRKSIGPFEHGGRLYFDRFWKDHNEPINCWRVLMFHTSLYKQIKSETKISRISNDYFKFLDFSISSNFCLQTIKAEVLVETNWNSVYEL